MTIPPVVVSYTLKRYVRQFLMEVNMHKYDDCPKCGGPKKASSIMCASCRWPVLNEEELAAREERRYQMKLKSTREWRARNQDKCRTYRPKGPMTEREKDMHRARQRRRTAKNRVYLAEYKVSVGCVDCGYKENPVALQFDHVRGEKTRNLSQMGAKSLERIITEIDKCEVRCANCHSIKTYNERQSSDDLN